MSLPEDTGLEVESNLPILRLINVVKRWRASSPQLFSEFLKEDVGLAHGEALLLNVYRKGYSAAAILGIIGKVGPVDKQMIYDLPWNRFKNQMIAEYNAGTSPRQIVDSLLKSTGIDFSDSTLSSTYIKGKWSDLITRNSVKPRKAMQNQSNLAPRPPVSSSQGDFPSSTNVPSTELISVHGESSGSQRQYGSDLQPMKMVETDPQPLQAPAGSALNDSTSQALLNSGAPSMHEDEPLYDFDFDIDTLLKTAEDGSFATTTSKQDKKLSLPLERNAVLKATSTVPATIDTAFPVGGSSSAVTHSKSISIQDDAFFGTPVTSDGLVLGLKECIVVLMAAIANKELKIVHLTHERDAALQQNQQPTHQMRRSTSATQLAVTGNPTYDIPSSSSDLLFEDGYSADLEPSRKRPRAPAPDPYGTPQWREFEPNI